MFDWCASMLRKVAASEIRAKESHLQLHLGPSMAHAFSVHYGVYCQMALLCFSSDVASQGKSVRICPVSGSCPMQLSSSKVVQDGCCSYFSFLNECIHGCKAPRKEDAALHMAKYAPIVQGASEQVLSNIELVDRVLLAVSSLRAMPAWHGSPIGGQDTALKFWPAFLTGLRQSVGLDTPLPEPKGALCCACVVDDDLPLPETTG
jgi:hypothetical protein